MNDRNVSSTFMTVLLKNIFIIHFKYWYNFVSIRIYSFAVFVLQILPLETV